MKAKHLLLFSLILLLFPAAAFALDPASWFATIITNLINFVIWPIFAGASIIMFIVAGLYFVTSNGDPSKISTAKKMVIWAIIGVAIGLLAATLPFIIASFIPA